MQLIPTMAYGQQQCKELARRFIQLCGIVTANIVQWVREIFFNDFCYYLLRLDCWYDMVFAEFLCLDQISLQ